MKVALLVMFSACLQSICADVSSGNVSKLEAGWRGRIKKGTGVSNVATWWTGPGKEANGTITSPVKADAVDQNLRGRDPCCPAADGKCYSCQSGGRCYPCKSCSGLDIYCYCYECSGADGNCYNYDCGSYCSDVGCVNWPFEKSYYP